MAAKKTKTKRAASTKSAKPTPKSVVVPEQPKIDISVRTLYHDGQHLPALCFRHPESAHAIVGDPIVGVRDLPLSLRDHDRSGVVFYAGAPYPPVRFAAHMRTHARNGLPVTAKARELLLPLAPDMPAAYVAPDALAANPLPERPPSAERAPIPPVLRAVRAGALRTSGKELIRELAKAVKQTPEKVRAMLRAAGLRAPYTDATACRKALGVKS